MTRVPPIVILLVLLLVPLAAAHGAPSPRDQDIRLLADYNDDCGGDESGGLQQCRGTHDVIALDVREAYDAGLGDVVVFRLFLNGAAASGLRDVVSFKAGGAAKTVELRTDDNVHFTGSGFDAVSQAQSINDGTRFVVEATVRLSSLGGVGTELTGYKVDAYKGTTSGDFMPGTYHGALGDGPVPATESSQPTKYERGQYALRGPSYLLQLSHDDAGDVPADGEHIVAILATNPLRTTAQTVTFTLSGGSGAMARFHNAANGDYSDTVTVDMAKAGQTNVHVAIDGEPGASGTFTVTAMTSLGGRTTHDIAYQVAQPDGNGEPPASPPASPPGGPSKGSPALPLPAFLLAVAAALAIARRRA